MKEKIKDAIATILMIGAITFLTLSLMQLWEIQKEIKEIKEETIKTKELRMKLQEKLQENRMQDSISKNIVSK